MNGRFEKNLLNPETRIPSRLTSYKQTRKIAYTRSILSDYEMFRIVYQRAHSSNASARNISQKEEEVKLLPYEAYSVS